MSMAAGIHPGILEIIKDILDDLPQRRASEVKDFFIKSIESITKTTTKITNDTPEAFEMYAYYTGGAGGSSIAGNYGFETMADYQAAYLEALNYYVTERERALATLYSMPSSAGGASAAAGGASAGAGGASAGAGGASAAAGEASAGASEASAEAEGDTSYFFLARSVWGGAPTIYFGGRGRKPSSAVAEASARVSSKPAAPAYHSLPDLLGVTCFSLKSMKGKAATTFDSETITTHKVPTKSFFMRMSSSSKGAVVMVEKTGETTMSQSRLVLVFDSSITSPDVNPFRIITINDGTSPFIKLLNESVSTDATAPISVPKTEGGARALVDFLIPLGSNIQESLMRLGAPMATFEKAAECFSSYYRSKDLKPFDAPAKLASKSFSSGACTYFGM